MHSLKAVLPLLLLLADFGCTSPQLYPQGQLADQILVARKGHEGKLTNQTCVAYEKDKCAKMNVVEYDVADQTFRDTVRRLQFVCKMGGKQYRFCPTQAGFCRTTFTGCNWLTDIFGGCTKNVEFVPITPTQVLVDSHIKCFSESQYSWDGIE